MRLLLVWLIFLSGCQWREVSEALTTRLHFDKELTGTAFALPAAAQDVDSDPDTVSVVLRATAHTLEMFGQSVEGFAYNGQVPGPTIYAKRGDRITVEFHNDLESPSTLHWHGLHVPIDMDGVVWQRDPVMPGESFTYSFVLNQSGTYWYHPHFDTNRMMDLGLYGAIVIEDPAEPVVDQDLVMVFDSWGEMESREGVMHHGEVDGKERRWTVNGVERPTLSVPGGDVVRARIINASNGGFLHLQWPDMDIISRDQGLLAALDTPDSVVLAPGDRVEGIWRVGQSGFNLVTLPYTVLGGNARGDSRTLMTVEVVEPSSTAAFPPFVFSGAVSEMDGGPPDVTYVLSGSAFLGTWVINGETFPDVTVEEVDVNESAVIEVRNLSDSEHPFHLHGYGFEVLSRNGIPSLWRTIEDTINLRIYDTVRLKIDGNNPGDWMAHCHILPHQEGGMMTVLRVH